ncbi:MAG: hypothetical protein ACYTGL_30630 [Planctomycetota bacterium]|jgi:hypothetical protein
MPREESNEPATTARRFLDWFRRQTWLSNFVIGIVCFVVIKTIWPGSDNRPGEHFDRVTCPPEYVALATHFAEPLYQTTDEARATKEMDEVVADLERDQLAISGIQTDAPELQQVCGKALAVCDGLHADVTRIQKLPQPPGVLDSIVGGFYRGFTFDLAGIASDAEQLVALDREQTEVVQSLAAHSGDHKSVLLMLAHLAEQYAGAVVPVAERKLIDIGALVSWGSFQDNDWLYLINRAGQELNHCTILVEIQGRNGQTVRNVHFVEQWAAGATLWAKYSTGTHFPQINRTLAASTVADMSSVTVSVWCEEFAQTDNRLAFWGEVRDKVIAEYCRDLKIESEFIPYEEGLVWDTQRGVVASLDGIPGLPASTVTIQFTDGTRQHSQSWKIDAWNNGGLQKFDTRGKLQWDPTSYELEISFTDTGYIHHNPAVTVSRSR